MFGYERDVSICWLSVAMAALSGKESHKGYIEHEDPDVSMEMVAVGTWRAWGDRPLLRRPYKVHFHSTFTFTFRPTTHPLTSSPRCCQLPALPGRRGEGRVEKQISSGSLRFGAAFA